MAIELEGLVTEAKARQIEQEKFISYITDFGNIALIHATGTPVDNYILTFNLNAYRPTPKGIEVGRPHHIQIILPPEYPQEPPQVTALTPLYHPAVNPANGAIDVGKLWASSSSPSLQKLVAYLARIIPGSIYKVPDLGNPEAIQWYEDHANDLPLDVAVRARQDESRLLSEDDPDDPYAMQVKMILDLLKRNQIFIAIKELASLPPELDFPERDEVELRIRSAQKGTERLVGQIKELDEIRRLVGKNQIYALAGRMARLPQDLWFPERDDILAGIEQAKQASQGLFRRSLAFEERGAYGKALGCAQAVLRYIPDHPEAKTLIDRLLREHDLRMSDAEEAGAEDPGNPLAAGIKHKEVKLKTTSAKIVTTKKVEEKEPPPEKPAKKLAKKTPNPRKPRKPLNLPKLPENFPWKRILWAVTGILCLAALGVLGKLFMDDRASLQRAEEALALGGTQMQAKSYVAAQQTLARGRTELTGMTLLAFKKGPLVQRIDAMATEVRKGLAEQKRLEEEERARKEAEELAARERERRAAEAEAEKRKAAEGGNGSEQKEGEAPTKLSPEELRQEEARLQEAMDAVLPDAKLAFENRQWDDAAKLYQRALDLATDSAPEVREKMSDFLRQVERIRDLSRINGSLDEAQAAAGRKEWTSVIRLKNEALAVITKSSFSKDADFAELKTQLQEQVNEHRRDQAMAERTRSLEARGIEHILKSFPNYKKENLSQPRAKFLRREGSRHIYELSVVDRSQGRPSRLTMLFAYDERTKQWERVLQ